MGNNKPALEFDVVAQSGAGCVSRLRIRVADSAAATERVEREGLRVLSCKRRKPWLAWAMAPNSSVPQGRLDVGLFAHELASLLDAGLGIVDAIETLAERERSAETIRIFQYLIQALKEGKNLSAAMAELCTVFSPLIIASVSSSEQTGDMASALRRYASNTETLRAIRAKVLSAAVYPMLLLAVGGVVVLFLLGVVVPKFAILIESSKGDIPFASRILIGIGQFINAHTRAVVILLVVGIAIFATGVAKAARKGWNLSFLQTMPLVGPLIRTFRHAQFYRTSGMLIEGGISAVRAFDMCGALLTPVDRHKLSRAVMSIREGAPIGSSLQTVGLADSVTLRMLTVAQRTGQLAEILARIAAFHELTLARSIEVIARLFEPMLMLIIGLIIGAIVVLMYLPIFDLASSLQ